MSLTLPAAATAQDSLAPDGADPSWLPDEEWVNLLWLPFDEQTLRRIRTAVAHPEPLEAPRTVVVDTTRRVAVAALARTLRAETRGRHGFAAP